MILPEQNAPEAASIGGPGVYGVRSLEEAIGFIAGREDIAPAMPGAEGQVVAEEPIDNVADVAGPRYAKRALEVSAAGGHNILI